MINGTKRIFANSVVLLLCLFIAMYGSSLGTVVISVWGNIAGTLTNQTDLNTALGLKLPTTSLQSGVSLLGTTTSASATVYTVTMSPTLTAYTSGQAILWKVSTSCTGGTATTINVDGLGAKSLTQADGSTNPAAVQCATGLLVPIWYDGTVFRIAANRAGLPLLANNGSDYTALTFRTNLGLGTGDSPTLTALTLSAVPSAHVFNSAVQSIPDTTATLVTFDSETWDTGATHSTVSNTDRITVPTGGGGTWLVTGQVVFAASALGRRVAQIRKNDTAICAGKQLAGDATFTSLVSASCIVQLAATDYLNMTAQQVSTGALNTVAGTSNTFLQATKLY